MAYDATKPLDDGYLAEAPAELRELHRALKEDKIVNAGMLNGYTQGNESGKIPLNNGTLNTNLNADMLDGHDSAYFSASTHGHDAATTSANGFMTATQVTKLNGIATGAEVNQNAFANVKVGSSTIQADGKTDTLELAAGRAITLTVDTTNDKVTIAFLQPPAIELSPPGGTTNGGLIDFHYGGSSVDYTSRIIENVSGNIQINGVNISSSNVAASGGFSGNLTGNVTGDVTGNSTTATKIATSNIDCINIDTNGAGANSYIVGIANAGTTMGTRPELSWCNIFNMDTSHFASQIAIAGIENNTTHIPRLYIRSKYKNQTDWSNWVRFARHVVATPSADGLLSANDKSKLDNAMTINTSQTITARKTASGNNVGWNISNGTQEMRFEIGSGGVSRGLYDMKLNKWVFSCDNTKCYVGGYSIEKSVPSNAVFTDTVYTHPTTAGNKHIPSGGSSGQILKYSEAGTAVWSSLSDANIATKPNTSSGVGQVVSWSNVASYTLPSGGTWLVIADSHSGDSSYCTLQYHGLYSGGSKISGSTATSGLAWRIA